MVWSAGAVFCIIWNIIFLPLQIVAMIFFWRRRDIQPIKARLPALVIQCDVILILFELALCVQRIIVDSYPCLLNLWSGFIGLLVLFNTYMGRCWVLYFTFSLTKERLEGKKKSQSFFLRNRYFASGEFLFQVLGTLTVILIFPAGIVTAQFPALSDTYGDNCDLRRGFTILASYAALYLAAFIYFAIKLRQVVDAFKIKEELKWTAAIGIVCLIPWVIFNSLSSAREVNTDTFPFSTLFLLIGVGSALFLSTMWPLYRSYAHVEGALSEDTSDLTTLQGCLSDKNGLNAFKKFLTKEFSVENILFYEEIEEYRARKRRGAQDPLELLAEAQRIYAKYIINDSPFQVNLPDSIIRDLEDKLKELFAGVGSQGDGPPASPSRASMMEIGVLGRRDPPTLFDNAQDNIYKLMNSDSFQRFARSDDYKKLALDLESRKKTRTILEQEGVLSEKKSVSSKNDRQQAGGGDEIAEDRDND